MHPILVRIPLPEWKFLGDLHAVPIHSYGVMLGLSLVLGWYLALGLGERDGLPKEALGNCYVVTAVTAVVMSRVFYYVTNPSEFKSFFELLALWRGGLVAYGGFLGGFFGSLIYMRREKIPLWPWADVTAPGLAAGLMLTRIGCYLFGCDFGKPLSDDAPEWLKKMGTFPHWPEGTLPHGSGSPAWLQHLNHNLVDSTSVASRPVHPTQIYESLVGAFLLCLVLWVRGRQKFRGQVFLTFVFGYGVLRFWLEMLRDDLERGQFGPYLPEHWMMSLGLLAFALTYIFLIAPSVSGETTRKVTIAAALVPPVVAFVALRPASFADAAQIQLSTSQWVALLTAVPAAIAYFIYFKAAEMHPDSAMALDLDAYYASHPDRSTDAQVVSKSAEQSQPSSPVSDTSAEGASAPGHDEPREA
ncbi:MAG TPA: prolipoprotein diacylglyceryl transferase family protein [Polyangiaceae bacterium]|jgi:phosphatidylglycerol:prolipoprotein diacylglycerol transferase